MRERLRRQPCRCIQYHLASMRPDARRRSSRCQQRFTTTKTPTSPPSTARRSPSSATARRATPTPRTCATAASTVVVGQRPGGKNYDLAISHGFKPVSAADATKQADIINILVPDELQGDLYEKEIKPNLKPGNILMCSHGFNVHFGFVKAPEGVDTLLVAPKGPGHLVRSEFIAGGGVPCLIATNEGASAETFEDRPGLRQGHRRHARRRHPHHHSPRKPKPTCSASRPSSAAARAPW